MKLLLAFERANCHQGVMGFMGLLSHCIHPLDYF